MRLIAVKSSLIALLVLAQAHAQPELFMTDPVFGVEYDMRKVHFEYAPESLERTCAPDLRGRTRFWLYADWKEGNSEYLVISNRESQAYGGAAVIQGGKCVLGVPYWVLSGDPQFNPGKSVVFTDRALHGLATDLLRRYSLAYGGKKSFLAAVNGPHRLPMTESLPVALRREFDRFAKSP